jgi:hypothetical protein
MRDGVVEVRGVPAESIFQLLADFPELRRMFVGKRVESEIVAELVAMGGRILATVIAAGCGFLGNEKAITNAQVNLTVGESTQILEAMMRMTFPQGARNFIEALTAALKNAGVGLTSGPAMKSPGQSKNASAQDTRPTSHGGTPPASLPHGADSSPETKTSEQ